MGLSNAQYDAILREYEEIQSIERAVLAKHQAEVSEKLPAYHELEVETSALAMSYARKKLENPDFDTGGLHKELAMINQKKEALLMANGYPKDYLSMKYRCPDCQDTGLIGHQKCHCFKQKMINLLYEQSGIMEMLKTENFSTMSFDYFDGDDLTRFQNAVENCRNYVETFNKDYRNLFFYGTVGTGKSFLSGCVAKELLEKGNSVIYFSATDLFERLSKSTFQYKNKETADVLLQDLYNCDLLIIDDLGTEFTTALSLAEFFSLINERHLRKKSTIISTNLSLDDLQDRYKDRIFSRLFTNYNLIKLTGPDIRILKKRKLIRK